MSDQQERGEPPDQKRKRKPGQQEPADRPEPRSRSVRMSKRKRGRGPDKRKRSYPKNRKPGCGRKPFVPTQSEKFFVHCMAGMKMTTAEICKVIGGGRGANGDGEVGKPLSPKTLYRYFKKELEAGPSLLRAKITGNFYRALEEGAPWATQFGLRNRFGWHTGTGMCHPSPHSVNAREPLWHKSLLLFPDLAGVSVKLRLNLGRSRGRNCYRPPNRCSKMCWCVAAVAADGMRAKSQMLHSRVY